MERLEGERVMVLGLGRSGIAAARLAARRGARVVVTDDDAAAVDRALDAGLAAQAVAADAAIERVARVDRLVVSPGVPLSHPVVAAARAAAVRVVGELELAAEGCRARIVAVSGTNGKSTTVELLAAMLRAAGVDVVVAGNVGTPLADVVDDARGTIVLEVSSFQLDTLETMRWEVGVLLNVTPDHLDRYGGDFDAYAASKREVARRTTRVYAYNADDAVAAAAAALAPRAAAFALGRVVDAGAALVDGRFVRVDDGACTDVAPREALAQPGDHFALDALAAMTAAFELGAGVDAVRRALEAWRGLPHRMEVVRRLDGVTWIDDSKATNVDAALCAVEAASGPAVVILGGRDKDGDFTPLRALGTRVRAGVVLGEAADRIADAIGDTWTLERACDMADAVARARRLARPGDVVLLAPACASFDMFTSYAHRGEVFRGCVEALEPREATR